MVVDKIDIARFAVLEAKNKSPIGSHSHRPKSFQLALQRMQPKGRLIHILNPIRSVEKGKDAANAVNQLWRQLAAIIVFVKLTQAFMPKVSNHGLRL